MTNDGNINWTDCVGVLCYKDEGFSETHVLMIQRGQAPRKGEWSIPGGRIETGESEQIAALRELMEETGVNAALGKKVATIPAIFEGYHYMLHDYIATWTHGTPRAGDDAMDCAFVPISEVPKMELWTKTRDIILEGHQIWQDTRHAKRA